MNGSVKLLQLTNMNIGAVEVDAFIPLGVTTIIYPGGDFNCGPTYTVTSSTSDTLQVNKQGTYKVIYNASVVATEAGNVVLELMYNNVSKYTVTAQAAAAGTVNLTIPYEIYIPGNCCNNPINIPANIQIKNTGVALTSGTSNLIISKE
jgi:hypothetical protein